MKKVRTREQAKNKEQFDRTERNKKRRIEKDAKRKRDS